MKGHDPDSFRADLPEGLGSDESDALLEVAARLASTRPPPRPDFRGDLRRRLAGAAGKRTAGRGASAGQPMRLAAYLTGSGFALLIVAAVGLAGIWPFATG
jgi:hypothetical protein